VDPNSVLLKHRRYLKGLELHKNAQHEDRMLTLAEKEIKTQKFKENASKQRSKIRTLKGVELQNSQQDNYYQPEEPF